MFKKRKTNRTEEFVKRFLVPLSPAQRAEILDDLYEEWLKSLGIDDLLKRGR